MSESSVKLIVFLCKSVSYLFPIWVGDIATAGIAVAAHGAKPSWYYCMVGNRSKWQRIHMRRTEKKVRERAVIRSPKPSLAAGSTYRLRLVI